MNLVAFASDTVSVFHIADEMRERGWFVQPQLGYADSRENIHLSVNPASVRWVDSLLSDLGECVEKAKTLPSGELTAKIRSAFGDLDPAALGPETFARLLEMAGVEGTALPGRMAEINEVLNALPVPLRERLLVEYLNELYRQPAFVIALAFVIGIGAASASADPFAPRRASDTSRQTPRLELQDFSELRRLEAGRELRALSRDANRKVEERRLRSEGSRADVERYRQRARAEEELDRLTARHEVDALAPGSGFERFGPETRRVLERSQIELRWVQRRHDLELRLHEIERTVADREPVYLPAFSRLPRARGLDQAGEVRIVLDMRFT